MMNEFEIDMKHSAFISIDLQKGILNRELKPYSANEVISNAAKIADKFREKGSFVVLVNVSSSDGNDMLKVIVDQPMQMKFNEMPKDWVELAPELNVQKSDHLITKRQWGAFYGTELDLQLRRRNINTIILCGISTNIGVETTAREAYEHGYNQIFAIDACTAISEEEHRHSEKFIFPKIGLVRKTEQILKAIK